jgi:Rrf2 family iron-sulfur cluster assembly transcriptional regulator
MRVTTKGRYALRAVVQLTRSFQGKPISIKQLADAEQLSPEFLEQIFFKLRKANIIASTRGPGGGFSLKKDAKDISVGEIFEAVGEGINLTPCTTIPELEHVCTLQDGCKVHNFWADASAYVRDYFFSRSVADIIEKGQTV